MPAPEVGVSFRRLWRGLVEFTSHPSIVRGPHGFGHRPSFEEHNMHERANGH